MGTWDSLFTPSANAATTAAALRERLVALGYTLFDPFGVMPGKAYRDAVRLFVSPSLNGWVRVIGEMDAALPSAMSHDAPCLLLRLEGDQAVIQMYHGGVNATPDTLAPYLKPARSTDDIHHILSTPDLTIVPKQAASGLPLNALPDDVQALAGKVDMSRAQSMFNRMAGTVAKRAGDTGGNADAARNLIAQGSPPDWTSAGGLRLAALIDCLTIADGWQTPEFTTLRDAYQLHARKRRNPNADLYPGDADAMRAVPDALAYLPVYGGKNG